MKRAGNASATPSTPFYNDNIVTRHILSSPNPQILNLCLIMFNNRPTRQRAFQQSRFMRSKPTKRHFFQSFTTQRSARSRLYVQASPIQEVSSSKTVVRITLGLLLLHVVIIGGVLVHENMGKSTQVTPEFSKKPDAVGPGELSSTPEVTSTTVAKKPTPAVAPSAIATARDATYQATPQEVLPPPPSDIAISSIPPANPANPSDSATAGDSAPVELVAVVDTPGQNAALTAVDTTPRAQITVSSNASAHQRRQAQRGNYKTSAGETWQHVAAKHSISESALKKANPEMLHYENLYPGAVLVIPSSSTPPPQPPPFRPSGANNGAAAATTGQRDLIDRMDPTYIDPVELLILEAEKNKSTNTADSTAEPSQPTPPADEPSVAPTREVVAEVEKPEKSPAGTSVYSIRRGDTLSRIAKRHGMTLNALLKLNNIPKSRAGRIKPGQKVKVITKKRR